MLVGASPFDLKGVWQGLGALWEVRLIGSCVEVFECSLRVGKVGRVRFRRWAEMLSGVVLLESGRSCCPAMVMLVLGVGQGGFSKSWYVRCEGFGGWVV